MIHPRPIVQGSRIAIITPATQCREQYIDAAVEMLRKRGYVPKVMGHTYGKHGTYSGSIEERTEDFRQALEDNSVDAILCSRGGYGAVHLLNGLPMQYLRDNAKWIIGFSDISCLHALMYKAGVCSLHAPMAKGLSLSDCKEEDLASAKESREGLFAILEGDYYPKYSIPAHRYNVPGKAEGTLIGGNMAVLSALQGTPFDAFHYSNSILFIEDIGEAVYSINRMLYQMLLSDTFSTIKGLVVGQFTNYKVDTRDGLTMEDMIHEFLTENGLEGQFPVAYDFPVGHVAHNIALIEGAEVELNVTEEKTTLNFV